MALAHSPQIVTNGLVFYYDMANTKKSWFGKPTTNFYTNGHFSNGTGITQESGSNATNTVIFFPYNPGNSEYVLEQSGGPYTEYQINLSSQLLANTTYVLSGWYGESIDYVGDSRMFHCRAFSSSGAHVALGTGIGTVLETRVINGITWKYCYDIITTPSDYSNEFNWYLGYGGGSYTGKRYYTNIQMEQGNYPNRFVNGTRSNTQAITDLVGTNTITASSLTYASDDTFRFGGNGQRLDTNLTTFGNNATWEAWINGTSDVSTYNMFMGRYLPYFGFYGANSLYFSNLIGGAQQTIQTATNLTTNTWYHAVFTTSYNGTNTTMKIYTNGIETATGTFSGAQGLDGAYNFAIGDGYNASWYRFDGRVGSTKVYNRTLTASEVLQNFNALRGRYGI